MKSPIEIKSSTTVSINFGCRFRFKDLMRVLLLLLALFAYGPSGLRDLAIALIPPAIGEAVFRKPIELDHWQDHRPTTAPQLR
jgi:hypothetical protein